MNNIRRAIEAWHVVCGTVPGTAALPAHGLPPLFARALLFCRPLMCAAYALHACRARDLMCVCRERAALRGVRSIVDWHGMCPKVDGRRTGAFIQYLGARRRQTPRPHANSKVPTGASRRGFFDATLDLVCACRGHVALFGVRPCCPIANSNTVSSYGRYPAVSSIAYSPSHAVRRMWCGVAYFRRSGVFS